MTYALQQVRGGGMVGRANFPKFCAALIGLLLLFTAPAFSASRLRWRDVTSQHHIFSSAKRFHGQRVHCVSRGLEARPSFLRKKPGSRKQRQFRPISRKLDLLGGRSYAKSSREYLSAAEKYERYRIACNPPPPSVTPSPSPTATSTPTTTPGQLSNSFALTGKPDSVAPYSGPWTARHVSHLLMKAGLGGNRDLFEYGIEHGRAALVTKLLTGSPSAADLAGLDNLGQTLDEHAYASAKYGAFTATGDVCKTHKLFAGKSARLYNYAYASKGGALSAYMDYLLQDHFSVNLDQTLDTSLCTRAYGTKVYVDSVHTHALGSFRELLFDFIRFDIMMNGWLDNTQNKTIAINENFARELIELYTHGICPRDGRDCAQTQNYYEPTVRELARALTGFVTQSQTGVYRLPDDYFWNWDATTNQQIVAFSPHPNFYDSGTKVLYEGTSYATPALTFTTTWAWDSSRADAAVRSAQTIPALDYVLGLNVTREQIAHKMFSQLVYPNPAPELTAQLAQILLDSDYDLGVLASAILNSDAMFSPQAQNSYISSPFENLMSFLRASGMNAALLSGQQYALFDSILGIANNQPLSPPDVFGFRGGGVNRADSEDNRGEIWLSSQSLLARQNGMLDLADSIAFSAQYDAAAFVDVHGTDEEVLDQSALRFDVTLSDQQRARLLSYLNEGGGYGALSDSVRKARIAGLAIILSNTMSALLK